MAQKLDTLPKAFIWRRLHSLTGLWLVLFLIEHLITNSQAALLFGESGKGFVRMVNALHNLPYRAVIEVALLGVPILIHMLWGIRYAITAKPNSKSAGGKKPHLKYGRNHAYTWQRITSWILVVLLILHVVKFRFLEYPETVNAGATPSYIVKVTMDPGLYTVAGRLGVQLYDSKALTQLEKKEERSRSKKALEEAAAKIRARANTNYSAQEAEILQSAQNNEERRAYVDAVVSQKLDKGELVAVSPSFGTASLLTVRDTFKNPWWVGVYTVFVLSACFHAFQGLWTSMLTWGWVIKATAQTSVRKVTITLMILLSLLGLAAVWGTYFLNLKN